MPPTNLPNDKILNKIYSDRIRALQAVDDMVGSIIVKLEKMRVMDNTYFIFTSDNGFHIGKNVLTLRNSIKTIFRAIYTTVG